MSTQPVPEPTRTKWTILNDAIAGLLVGVSIAGGITAGMENRARTRHDAALDKALAPVKDQAAQAQLASGTLTVSTPKGDVTVRCAPLADGGRDCGAGGKFSKEAFAQAVRADAGSRIDRQFAQVYSLPQR
ncbi:MAG: hypothetical protein PW734_07715 [Verrucomicrobium sp.]|nr:hypothetical protein [Verrucomicrobium sp.]